MELIVKEYEQPKPIEFNFEELKAELTAKVAHYETLVYTDDQIKEAKADRANLNKLKKALNDERIKREREYMAPFYDFKKKIGDIIAIIDKPVAVIDAQVKAYEEKCREDKRAEIEEYFETQEARPDWLKLSQIWRDDWLNASYPIKTVQTDIVEAINRVNVNIDTIKNLTEFSFEAMEVFKTTLDINRAISEGSRMAEIQRKKEEREKRAAEYRVAAMSAQLTDVDENEETEPEGEPAQWISFSAHLTLIQAIGLKRYFEEHGIEYKPVREV